MKTKIISLIALMLLVLTTQTQALPGPPDPVSSLTSSAIKDRVKTDLDAIGGKNAVVDVVCTTPGQTEINMGNGFVIKVSAPVPISLRDIKLPPAHNGIYLCDRWPKSISDVDADKNSPTFGQIKGCLY